MTPTKDPAQGAATGPDGDHTSGNGNYVYVESSGDNNPSKKANIISPLFDLSTLKEGTCTFWYHMFSDNEGTDEMGDMYQYYETIAGKCFELMEKIPDDQSLVLAVVQDFLIKR